MDLGQKLYQLRKEKSLTQKEVANLLNISRSTYTHYEKSTREPDLAMLNKIAGLMDVSLDYLCGLSTQRKSSQVLFNYIKRTKEEFPDLKLSDLNLEELNDFSD